MVDVMTREQRRRCMAAIKGKNTKPEMLVRKFLFSKGLRYRVNNHKLPGSPDIVFKKYRTVVFIDGCFWHGHEDCKYFHIPKSNTDFWRQKVAANIARDYVNTVDLTLAGWRVVRVWECDVRTKAKREATLEKLYRTIIVFYILIPMTGPVKIKHKQCMTSLNTRFKTDTKSQLP